MTEYAPGGIEASCIVQDIPDLPDNRSDQGCQEGGAAKQMLYRINTALLNAVPKNQQIMGAFLTQVRTTVVHLHSRVPGRPSTGCLLRSALRYVDARSIDPICLVRRVVCLRQYNS